MAVKHTTDADLLFEVATHERVILKYFSETCGGPCFRLLPLYEMLSRNEKYNNIAFYRINADFNPVALKLILARKQPLMAIYHKGMLIDCKTIDSEDEIVGLIEKLSSMTPLFVGKRSTCHEKPSTLSLANEFGPFPAATKFVSAGAPATELFKSP